MCNRIFFSCAARPSRNIITSPFIRFSTPSDLQLWRSSHPPFGFAYDMMQVQDRYREVEDNCKTFLGNLRRDCGPEDVRAWLNGEGYKLAIPCKMVIRGRSGIRRGLDALTRGVGLPPIKVAPSSKLEHILFRFKLDEVNLPAALVHSVRFLTCLLYTSPSPRDS